MKKGLLKIVALVMSFILLLSMTTFAAIAEDDGGKLPFDERFSDASDVPLWAQNGCEATYDAGIVGGFEDGTYRPTEEATRAQMWTYLYNCAKYLGKDVSVPSDYEVSFPDAVGGAWYEDALCWAAYNGIVCVSDAGTVAPDRAIMRWELAVECYRFATYAGLKYKETAASYNFSDIYMLPEWAAEPILGALKAGLLSNSGSTELLPERTCNRAQLAVYIYRIFDASYSAGSTLLPKDNEAADLPIMHCAFSVRMNTADKLFYGDCNDRVLGQVIFEDEGDTVDLQIIVKNALWENGVIIYRQEDLDTDNSIFHYSIDFGGTVEVADGREIELISESPDWYVAVLVCDERGNILTIDYKVTCLSITEGRELFAYSAEGNDASIYAYTGKDSDVFIPEMIDGYFVGELLDGAFADRGVKTLHIPESVYWIGDIMGEKDLSVNVIFNGSECEYNMIAKHPEFANMRRYTFTEENPPHLYTAEPEVVIEPSAIMQGLKARYCVYCYDLQDEECLPVKDVELPFTDVAKGAWYRKAVEFAVDEGLFNGMSETTFCPDTPMTRAMLVTVLYRMNGSPEVEADIPFTDVADSYYKKAVVWANANGIVNGVSPDRFAPDDNITREALATILYRYWEQVGFGVIGAADLTVYSDGKTVSGWAEQAMSWANGVGIIAGNNVGGKILLDPQGKATRAQVATMLARFSLYSEYGIIIK